MAELATHSCAWVRGILSLFASQGVDVDRLLREAHIDVAGMRNTHCRFAVADMDRLWTLAVEASGQATLGLDRQLARRHIHFELAAQAMWSSPDLGSGLAVLCEYLALIKDAAAFSMQPERGDRWLVFDRDSGSRSPRQRIEFMMLALHLLCQRVTLHRVRLLVAEFTFAEPPDLHPYRMAFHCPLRFGQSANRMRVGKEDLSLPILAAGESLFAVQDRVIESRLARLPGSLVTYRASEEIVRRLHLGEPRRQELALSLGLSDGDFERKLRTEGHSFEQLLDGVRMDLAAQYLRQPGYEPPQIANLLGWETTAQLTAACRRWFGANTDEFLHKAASPRARSARAADSTSAPETVPTSQGTSVR